MVLVVDLGFLVVVWVCWGFFSPSSVGSVFCLVLVSFLNLFLEVSSCYYKTTDILYAPSLHQKL